MADRYTPEEIQKIFDDYNDALRQGIPISEALAKEMADATKGVKNYTNQLNYSLNSLGTSIKNVGLDLANGAKGASMFNNSIESGAEVVAKVASQCGILGTVVGSVVKAFGMFLGAVNKQSDALYKSYQDVSRAGAIGQGGMTEVYDSMRKFGYTIDELGNLGTLLKENSKNFGLFTSSAVAGSRQFSEIADNIQNSGLRRQFFNLGMTVDDINNGIAGYIVQEGKLGKLRGRDQAELTQASTAYVREMEILTRLTGQTRQEMEQQREQALQIDAFYAGLKDLPKAAREEALKAFNIASSISPKMAAEFAANFNGVITGTTDLLMSTSGESLKYGRDFFVAGGKATDAMQGLSDAGTRAQEVTDNLAKVGAQFGLTSRELTMLTNKGTDPFAKSVADITAEVDAAAGGYDRATNAQSAMRDSQIKITQNFNDLVNLGITPVTRAMMYLTEVIENLTDLLPGSRNGKNPSVAPAVGGLAGAATGATLGAGVGSAFGPVGTVVGGLVGGVAGAAGGRFIGGKAADSESSPPAGGGITGESIQGLAPDFAARFQQASAEYKQLTGQSVKVTSAFRTYEKQAELYAAWVAGKSKFPAAPPGNSKHETGRAVDVDLATAEAMDRMGILSKYGLSRPVAGDPIHIQGSAGFRGTLSGPMSGYKPNIVMHGKEDFEIRPSGSGTGSGTMSASNDTTLKLIERIDDLIQISRNQLGVNEKMLRYQA